MPNPTYTPLLWFYFPDILSQAPAEADFCINTRRKNKENQQNPQNTYLKIWLQLFDWWQSLGSCETHRSNYPQHQPSRDIYCPLPQPGMRWRAIHLEARGDVPAPLMETHSSSMWYWSLAQQGSGYSPKSPLGLAPVSPLQDQHYSSAPENPLPTASLKRKDSVAVGVAFLDESHLSFT